MSNALGPPTQAGFTAFLRDPVGITTAQLPDSSNSITIAFVTAMGVVSKDFQGIDPDIYTLAVYNLATDRLINIAADQPGLTFFTGLRSSFGIGGFVAGVLQSSSDEGSSQSFKVSQAFDNLTLADLAYLSTPYGRQYLMFAQQLGGLWGLTQ